VRPSRSSTLARSGAPAGACRGKVYRCSRPSFFLLPQRVRDFFFGLADAQ
jgi:hypothetical protein